MEKLLTTKEVADIIGMHPVRLTKKAYAGEIKASKIGSGWRFRPCDVEHYIQQNDNSLAGRKKWN